MNKKDKSNLRIIKKVVCGSEGDYRNKTKLEFKMLKMLNRLIRKWIN